MPDASTTYFSSKMVFASDLKLHLIQCQMGEAGCEPLAISLGPSRKEDGEEHFLASVLEKQAPKSYRFPTHS